MHAGQTHVEDPTLMMGRSPAHSLGDSPSWSSSTTGQQPHPHSMVDPYYPFGHSQEENGTSSNGIPTHPYGEEASSAMTTHHGLSPHPASSWAHQRSPSATSLDSHPLPQGPHRYSQDLAAHQQQQMRQAAEDSSEPTFGQSRVEGRTGEAAGLLDMQEMTGAGVYHPSYTFQLQAPPVSRSQHPSPAADGLHPSLSRGTGRLQTLHSTRATPGALHLPRPYHLDLAGTPPLVSPPVSYPHPASTTALFAPQPAGRAQGYFELQLPQNPPGTLPGSAPAGLGLTHHQQQQHAAFHMPYAPSPQVALHMGPTPPPLLSLE